MTSLKRLRDSWEWEGTVVFIGDLAWEEEELPEYGKSELGTEDAKDGKVGNETSAQR